jgi:3-phosphoshikimate 1-carboxyvinyltransferase
VEVRPINPVTAPVAGIAPVPGSKSITNRALALAALCTGTTDLNNALFADDTARMTDCLRALGLSVTENPVGERMEVKGNAGRFSPQDVTLFVGNSGTTARFITPVAALGQGTVTIDGVPRMRERPMRDLIQALRQLGVSIESLGSNDCPPIRLQANGLHGGACSIRSDASSQFLSGLLLAAPCADGDTTVIQVEGPILSAPYIQITVAMVRAFGGIIDVSPDQRVYTIPGRQTYHSPGVYTVEPDASSASYFWAAAALTGGTVRVPGIGKHALQGDAAFVDVLAAMGCTVTKAEDAITVTGPDRLKGISCDMNAISDTVMTLAAIAPFADTPTVIENVAHIRHKETDRLKAVATELGRLGVRVEEREDGMTIYPVTGIRPAVVHTYDDHRMAMAFALVGLRASGVSIADPDCVAKTFPDYFVRLERLVAGNRLSLPV